MLEGQFLMFYCQISVKFAFDFSIIPSVLLYKTSILHKPPSNKQTYKQKNKQKNPQKTVLQVKLMLLEDATSGFSRLCTVRQ